IAAVGAGVYFLFLNKKKTEITSSEIQKELIVGKWKLDSLSQAKSESKLLEGLVTMIDSNFVNYAYQFQQDGKVLRLFKNSVQKNNSRFEWTKDDQLLFKQEADSIETRFTVSKLSKDSLILQSKDSATAFFSKVK
ncbi:MAG TPA: hypothetical protein VFZ33_16090, partial [Chitinophagaceae bacterium]